MLIEFYKRNNYGRSDRYPADQKIARSLHMITGKKVLDDCALQGLKELGFEFREVLPPIK